MNKKLRLFLNIFLVAVLAFSIYQFAKSELENLHSRQDYQEAKQIAAEETIPAEENQDLPQETQPAPAGKDLKTLLESDPNIEPLLAIDLEALREVNEDVIGWILIPGTTIDYPLLQWTDNDFYLNHTWKQTKNPAGSIFMEWQNNPDFTDFNTIIYGHNMLSKDMFGALRDYKNKGFLEKHPTVYILHDGGIYRYEIFAMQKAKVDSIIYGMQIDSEQRKKEYIRYSLDYSEKETGLVPTTEDRILTLSTCSGAGYETRFVVQCIFNEAESYIIPQ